MIIQFHTSSQELIKSNVYVPNELSKAFGLLLETVGEKYTDANTSTGNVLKLAFSKFQGTDSREVKDDKLCKVLEILFLAAKSDVENAYKQGKNDGANLLIQLNNGDLSLNDFNDNLK